MPNHCRACGRFTRLLHCNRKCYGIAQRGRSRKDRKSPSRKMYVQIVVEGKRVYLHRHIYEKETGKPIPPDCVVHHKNEDARINDFRNLEAKPRKEHLPRDHWRWQDRKDYYPSGNDDPEEFKEFGW